MTTYNKHEECTDQGAMHGFGRATAQHPGGRTFSVSFQIQGGLNSTTQLLAYHGKPSVKTTYLNRVKAHRKADLLAQGETGNPDDGQKGCAVACTMNRYDHYAYPGEIGVPVPWAQLEDAIFEGLPNKEAQAWPEAFLKAIKPGADLMPALDRFNARVLLEVSLPSAKGEPQPHRAVVEESIKVVAQLLIISSQDGAPSPLRAYWQAFEAAGGSAARSAARSAADSAARSAARSAAYSVAFSAAYSVAFSVAFSAARSAARSAADSVAYSAAYSVAFSAARSAAYSAAWVQMSKIALEELAACHGN